MEGKGIAPGSRWAMAVGCAVSVGNLYYIQPLLEQIAREFRVPSGQAGVAATLSQVGYAVGMLTIVPLGDAFERRRLVLLSLAATTLVLIAMAAAQSFAWLCLASLGIGIATVTPQLLVPFAAHLARPEERGRVVGFVMSGLLIGILLARTVSGFVGDFFGWRAMYLVAAGASVLLILTMRLTLPENPPSEGRMPYGRLMRSLVDLIREEPVLRQSAVFGGTLFGAFSAFWTTLAFYLAAPPFRLGPKEVGLFGLVGVAGALAAPIAGKYADRGQPRKSILIGILAVLLSYATFAIPGSLIALVVGVLLLDVGVQASHISNQSLIYARRPEARSRMNTVYMTAYFVGGSAGSALGAWGWSQAGWTGVCSVGMALAAIALGAFFGTPGKSA